MEARARTVLSAEQHPVQVDARAALSELVMAWARDAATGQPRYILELDAAHRGKKCGCECVSCGEPLTAVNAGKEQHTYKRRPHFRHPGGVSKDSCAVLAARAAALRLLIEDGVLDLPARSVSASWTGLSGKAYEGTASSPPERVAVAHVEYRDRASAVLELEGGRRVYVSLTGTNLERAHVPGSNAKAMSTIFIDVNDPALASLDPEELRSRLKLLPGNLCWRGHWNDSALRQRAELDAVVQAQELLDWPSEDGFDLKQVPSELRRETLLHLTVKEILSLAGHLRVPELTIEEVAGTGPTVRTSLREVILREQTLGLRNVRLEMRIGNMIPDVCAESHEAEGADMGTVFIEVTVTNGFDEERLNRIRQAGRPALEIDLREAFGRVSKSDLTHVVIEGLVGKRWLHYPGIDDRRLALKSAAEAAAGAKAEAQQGEDERSKSPAVPGAARQAGPVGPPRNEASTVSDLASAKGDLDRCKLLVAKRKSSGWAANEDFLDGLVSLRHGIGVGRQEGMSPTQIAHKLRCTVDTHLHALVLMVMRVFERPMPEGDGAVIAEWAAIARARLKQHDRMWMPKAADLSLLKDLFPELETSVERLLVVLERPAEGGPTWSTGEIAQDRRQRVEAVRNFYRDGAYRLYAPKINYDRVLDEAKEARGRQASLSQMLEKWSSEFSLGDDYKPILAVLREAGLVA